MDLRSGKWEVRSGKLEVGSGKLEVGRAIRQLKKEGGIAII
jgi:hypothetical protein